MGVVYSVLSLKQAQYNKMVNLINESNRGDGKTLRKLQKQLNKRKAQYSLSELSDFITQQNHSNLLCEFDHDKAIEIPMKYRKFKKYILNNL
jgi:hypothetical protein